MQNLLRIGYENILLKTSVNLWGDYPCLFGYGDSVGVSFNPVSSPAVSVCSGCCDRVFCVFLQPWLWRAGFGAGV